MIRLIVFLIVAAALAWVAVWLANSPGEVVLRWEATDTVLPVGIAVAIVAGIAAAAIVVYEVWRWLAQLPRRVRSNRQQKRQIRGYQELSQGLIAAAAGDVTGARAHTRQAEKLLQANAATLLLSAQTAQLEGKEDVAQLKFTQMLKRPQTEFLGIRGLLADAVKRNDQPEALALARRAYERSPNTSWVLTTYFDLLTRAGKWADALKLVNDLAREKLVSGPEATRRRALMKHMLAVDAVDEKRYAEALAQARRATGLAPNFAPAAVTAAQAANGQGKFRLARRLLEDCWRLEPHPDLAGTYGELVPDETADRRLRRPRGFEARAGPPRHPARHGRARHERPAQDTAKRHLDRALGLEPTAGAYRLYAEYERASGGGDAKARDWLAKAADAPADKVWVCEDTGEVLAEWQLFGPSGRFDSVHWDSPPKVAPMLRDQRPPVVLVHDQRSVGEPAEPVTEVDGTAKEPKDKGPGGSRTGPTEQGLKAPPPIEATVKAAGSIG
ncbi:MAG: heme biosynthesis HemY N-terminal domain-containing protein [Geminicoccaceae bacterium]